MLIIREHKSAKNFLRTAGSHLYKNEAANGLVLGICETLAHARHHYQQPPLLIRIAKEGETRTVAVQTPPHNLILTKGNKTDFVALAQYLFIKNRFVPGVIGPPKEVAAFLDHWKTMTPVKIKTTVHQRLYRLDRVVFPRSAKGQLEKATAKDARLLAGWLGDFFAESLPSDARSAKENLEVARMKVEQGQAFVWRVGRSAVSMAFATRPTRQGISIGPVFTPVSQREKGYASALVAYLSQHMLDEGKKFCTLYTDLSNPTSNDIYMRIGYRAIAESRHVVFK